MTEDELRSLLENHGESPSMVRNIVEGASASALIRRASLQGKLLSAEEAEILAQEVRKGFATQISLVATGVATPEDLLDG